MHLLAQPRFLGLQTTRQAQTQCLTGPILKRLLGEETLLPPAPGDTTVGKGLPLDLIPPGWSQQQVVEKLDALSALLSKIDLGLYRAAGVITPATPIPLPPMALRMGGVSFALSYVGHGNFGIVLKVKTAQRVYALKCFFPRDKEHLTSGPYNEAAVGTFVTGKGVSNMPHLFLAHPQAGWMLSEFADAQFTRTPRQGPTWESFGFEVLDTQVKENATTGATGLQYRLDYGHLMLPEWPKPKRDPRLGQLFQTREASGYIDFNAFLALFQANPELRVPLVEDLCCLDPAKRVRALQVCLMAPELRDYPLPSLVEVKALSAQDVNTLVAWMVSHSEANIRAKAVFAPSLLTPENRAKLETLWRNDPILRPLGAVYFQDSALMRRYLQSDPALDLVF